MKKILSNLLIIVSLLIIFSIIWAKKTYCDFTFDQIVFQTKVSQGGLEKSIILSYIKISIIPAILFFVFINIMLLYEPKNDYSLRIKFFKKEYNIQLFKHSFIKKHLLSLSTIILIITTIYSINTIELDDYVKNNLNDSIFIRDNYKKPNNIEFNQKRNLIYIYVESLETTYLSKDLGGNSDVNLLPNLTTLLKENVSFSSDNLYKGANILSGSTWTVAGLVSESSGMPLKLPIDGNTLNVKSKFMPGVITLGDILYENGYNQEIIMGSDSNYAARSSYFKQHGNYNIYDYKSAIKDKRIPADYKEWWGFEDSKLFKFAKDRILKLSKEEKPFNYQILTANTHFTDGYTEKNCALDKDNLYASSIRCSEKQIYDFVRWVQEQEFYNNTTIVICGDHLSMDTKYFQDIDPNYERRVFNLFINSPLNTDNTKNRDFTTLDMFPTTLASIGASIDGNKLGLGTNLFSNEKTLTEELGFKTVNNELNKKSKFYDSKILGY